MCVAALGCTRAGTDYVGYSSTQCSSGFCVCDRGVLLVSVPQTYVVKVEREGQQGATLVQRSFEEFHELHTKLRLIFPSSKLPR